MHQALKNSNFFEMCKIDFETEHQNYMLVSRRHGKKSAYFVGLPIVPFLLNIQEFWQNSKFKK